MSIEGKDARCVVTVSNVKDMVKDLNKTQKRKLNGIPINFTISNESSRCLREYTDLLLTDLANKYVTMAKYDTMDFNNNRNKNHHERNEKEKLRVNTILKQSVHLITNKPKPTLNECFIDKPKTNNDKISLNPIFLRQ